MAEVVTFLTGRGLPPSIQISTSASDSSIATLRSHGFRADSRRVVMAVSPVPRTTTRSESWSIETVDTSHLDEWARVLAEGNGAMSPAARAVSDEYANAAHHVTGSTDLLARIDGKGVGCGSLQRVGDTCWLGGAATLPFLRGRGLQRSLLDVRIDLARNAGAEIVAATAVPNSTSARNLERAGLELVDTQAIWAVPSSQRRGPASRCRVRSRPASVAVERSSEA